MMRIAIPKWVVAILAIGLLFALAACAGQQAPADTTATPLFDIPIDDLLVYVPAGSFYMGSDVETDPLARQDEFPLHLIRLDGFHIYRNEVTNDMYAQCVAAGKCSLPTKVDEDGPSHHYGEEAYKNNPVVGINWDQAVAFCTWAAARLPTEAEWEKTSRGESGDLYPWGNDNPSCDLSNMEGCLPEDDTDKIGQYPDGLSVFQAGDMSGNVWEWTADWYNPDYYGASPSANPLGPEDGELKVVRGGAFDNGVVDLRSASRFGLDPDDAFNDVGFRCVPIGLSSEASAPFCKSTYVPFCNDPNTPPEQNCDQQTGQAGTPTGGNPDFLGFTCPQGGYISFTMNGGGQTADQFEVTINGNEYNCIDTAGHIQCTGTALSQNTIATIQVCPAPNVNNSGNQLAAVSPTQPANLTGYQAPQAKTAKLMAYTPPQQEPAQLVAYRPPSNGNTQGLQGAQYQAPQLQSFQAATNDYCPTGMVYNETTGQCETDPNGACEDGWTYNEQTGQCDPGENGCPEGTTYNAAQQGCTPNDGNECPSPYIYNAATNTCQPPSNNDGGGACPAGYFYDQTISCCSPIKGDNNGCDPGTYLSVETNNCEPVDENGCPAGLTYNPYEGGCVPSTGEDTDGCRQEGYVMDEQGVCEPASDALARTVGGCSTDQYWDAQLQQCIDLGDGQCQPGYYYDANMQSCGPTDGPGSPCATGYAFNTRLNCCTPTPGTDGSSCPGDPQGDGAGATGLVAFPAPSETNYDYGRGYCDPNDTDPCPAGYYYNTDTQSCTQLPNGGAQPNPDGSCPDGFSYDESSNSCVPVVLFALSNQCGEGRYFDANLGYCVSTTCGCALGYYYNSDLQMCIPNGQGSIGEQGCVTFTQSVPECPYQPEPTPVCDKGTSYVPATRQCERNDQATQVACSSYGNSNACKTAGCTWTVSTTSYCH